MLKVYFTLSSLSDVFLDKSPIHQQSIRLKGPFSYLMLRSRHISSKSRF